MRTGGDFANLPMLQKTASRPEMQRMSRNEKKERGWKVGKQWKPKLDPLPCNVKCSVSRCRSQTNAGDVLLKQFCCSW